ncbi:uncharacterized protein STEHIDRAFT_109599 [Stereum hirsutum FP-91666 SS1]|uniref:uncharacterized protein n=1 Tax=Stereum hirsutum (strain FP-91666) TaxID=721885 RepID=UPI000440F617|nr:uncharacterized protein STEHIDRAFT_109599 [Stereum hirsutum FP-91666 SS1]EIM89413.1 hypothetical protein STEHIDRAFT_109599 [Stereum hirsutum FP-91666 SS1]
MHGHEDTARLLTPAYYELSLFRRLNCSGARGRALQIVRALAYVSYQVYEIREYSAEGSLTGVRSNLTLTTFLHEDEVHDHGIVLSTSALFSSSGSLHKSSKLGREIWSDSNPYQEFTVMASPDTTGGSPPLEIQPHATRHVAPTNPPPGPNSRFTIVFGRNFLLTVRTATAQFVVGTDSAVYWSTPSRVSSNDEPVVSLCIYMGTGLDVLFNLLRARLEEDGYEPRLYTDDIPPNTTESTDPKPSPLAHSTSFPTDLSLSLVGNVIAFDDLTSPGNIHGFRRLPLTCRPNIDDLYPIICGATNWYYHLRRCPAPSRRQLTGKGDGTVKLEVMEVEEGDGWDEMLMPKYVPVRRVKTSAEAGGHEGSKYVKERIGVGRGDNGPVYIEVEADVPKMYGQEITNDSKYALYPSLLYFDNSDFSIVRYYLTPSSPSTAVPNPPLPANSTLTPGYGASGTPPHLYFLRLNQDLDIGYIKLFLNTRYVDLSHIEQKSPFEGAEGARLAALSRGVGGGEDRQSKCRGRLTVTIEKDLGRGKTLAYSGLRQRDQGGGAFGANWFEPMLRWSAEVPSPQISNVNILFTRG